MKKFLKIFLITLASLILLLIIAAGIISWYVFTPEKLTPIVRKQAERFISAQTEIGKVELTLFSTFPKLGLRIEDVVLINPHQGAPSDTLAMIGEFTGFIDIDALRKKNELLLSGLSLKDGTINAFIDSLGNSNFDIFLFDPEDVEPDTDDEFPISFINTGTVKLQNINISYLDVPMGINTVIQGLDAALTGIIKDDQLDAVIDIIKSTLYLEHNGEIYFPYIDLRASLPLSANIPEQSARFSDALIFIDGMGFSLSGSMQNDVPDKNFLANIDYQTTEALPLKSLMALIPASFEHFFEGMVADGLIISKGNMDFNLKKSSMPLLDMHVEIDRGTFEYTLLPWPLRNISGNFHLRTDLLTDQHSFLVVNRMSARTPRSSYITRGRISNLFSDIRMSLNTRAAVSLDELNPFVPENMNLVMNGRAEGNIRSNFTLSQVMEMQLERINLSGKVSTSDLDIKFDSLWVNIDKADMGFAMPNPYAINNKARFIFADINANKIKAGEGSFFATMLDNAQIMLEASDVRDTTRIPDLLASFKMDYIEAQTDTISLMVNYPSGSASIAPVPGKKDHPKLVLAYNSENLTARVGSELLEFERIHLDTDIENDKDQEDFFLQWLINGFIDIDNGMITTTFLNHPIEIPAIKMDFEPERIDIKDSRMVIDNSDFSLSGAFDNVLSYFRGDSILRGNFSFASNTTDIMQLMTMTSGIGIEEDELASLDDNVNGHQAESAETVNASDRTDEMETESESNAFTGPYMVPQGIDISLATNIKHAIWGTDTATSIRGDVRISDGILLLDDIRFTTPAARMQMTAMYRTPRKNHLFLGLDYHMLDIEIERLLQMIPEIDTIMPMLRSFRGAGEFHMAIESYLDSTYTLKMSTLRGAASIRGKDLVLMDGETFSEIARTLRFSRRAENRVDSLSAEFTIFRNEIDVYPFLIVMDRYEAVVGGRHNLDMSFNYHISLVNSPLPVRLGIDVRGTMDNLSYRLATPRYAELYRPVSRGVVAGRQLELRQLIREALLQGLEE